MNNTSSPDSSKVAATLAATSVPDHRRWVKRILVAVVLLGGGAAAFFWWQRDTPADLPQYQTRAVQRGDLKVLVTATGNLAPVNQVEVGSELSGIVESVVVDYNDQVRVGQVLARLDTAKLEAQLLQSKASLNAAKAKVLQSSATVKETRRNLERLQEVKRLSAGKAVSPYDLDAAQASLDRALADQASAVADPSLSISRRLDRLRRRSGFLKPILPRP